MVKAFNNKNIKPLPKRKPKVSKGFKANEMFIFQLWALLNKFPAEDALKSKNNVELVRHCGEFTDDLESGWKKIQIAMSTFAFSEEAVKIVNSATTKEEINNLLSDVGNKKKKLYLEHGVPAAMIRKLLIKLQQTKGMGNITEEDIKEIMKLQRIVIITSEEQDLLDSSIENGGFGLRSKMPEGWNEKTSLDRFEAANIKIHEDTLSNSPFIKIR